jgi:hypothetical protein
MPSHVKANPGKINFASYTAGTLSHVMGLQVQIREAALKALAQPGARERLQEVGFEPGQPRTPEELNASLKSDYYERVGAVLKAIGFKPD